MWEMRVESALVQKLGSRQVVFDIAVTTIRDGTPGVSVSIEKEVAGQWTDSKAGSLTLTSDHKVEVNDLGGNPRYRLILPGTPVQSKALSPSDVTVTVQL